MTNAYAEAVASHTTTSPEQRNAAGRVLCTCGKPMSYRHIAAIGSAAQRKADAATPATAPTTAKTFGPGQQRSALRAAEHIRLWAVIDMERAIVEGDTQKVADLARAITESAQQILDLAARVGVKPSAR